MEYRDDNIVEEQRADAVFKRLIDSTPVQPQPASAELVARTLHRLPNAAPALAAQLQQVRTRRNRRLRSLLLSLLALVAAFNIWGVVAHGPQMAFMLGDGESGLSGLLLGLQLAVKPLWYVIRALDPLLIGGALLIAVASIWLTRRLVRRTQAHYEVETS